MLFGGYDVELRNGILFLDRGGFLLSYVGSPWVGVGSVGGFPGLSLGSQWG